MIIEYNGESKTLSEWAKSTGVSATTLSRRLRGGWTIEKALSTPSRKIFGNREKPKDVSILSPQKKDTLISRRRHEDHYSDDRAQKEPIVLHCDIIVNDKPTIDDAPDQRREQRLPLFEYKGESKTISEWSETLGISESVLCQRIKSGWSIDDVFSVPLRKRGRAPTLFEYNGESKTLSEWAKSTGVSATTLSRRLRGGWTIEKALSTPLRVSTLLEYKGESKTISEWSETLGISESVLCQRIKSGWSIDNVFSVPLRKCGRVPILFEYNGESKTLSEWSETLGINLATLRFRLRSGWSIDDAFSVPTKETKTIEFNGKTKTISEWGKEQNILPHIIRKRLNTGWSIEDALTTPPNVDRQSLERLCKKYNIVTNDGNPDYKKLEEILKTASGIKE